MCQNQPSVGKFNNVTITVESYLWPIYTKPKHVLYQLSHLILEPELNMSPKTEIGQYLDSLLGLPDWHLPKVACFYN